MSTASALVLVAVFFASSACNHEASEKPTTPAAPASTTEITFRHAAVAVGATWDRLETVEANKDLLVSEQGGAPANGERLTQTEIDERRVEVLAVADGRATKLLVKYLQKSETTAKDLEKKETTSVVAQKTYIVAREGAALSVTYEGGAPPSPAEIAIVVHDHADLGVPDPFVLAIPERPIKIGESIDGMATALRKLAKEGSEVSDARVRLIAIRPLAGGVVAGAFEYVLESSEKSDKVVSRTKIKGVQTLRSTDCAAIEESADTEVHTKAEDETAPGQKANATELARVRLHMTLTPRPTPRAR